MGACSVTHSGCPNTTHYDFPCAYTQGIFLIFFKIYKVKFINQAQIKRLTIMNNKIGHLQQYTMIKVMRVWSLSQNLLLYRLFL